MAVIHTLLFAEAGASLWGVFWLGAESGSAPLACQADGISGLIPARLEESAPGGQWRLEGQEASLVFEPSGPVGHGGSSEGSIDAFDQLCTVRGRVALGGHEHQVECLGWRARVTGSFELDEIDTFRQTYGWFDRTDGLSLLALRPRKSRTHDTDLVAASVLEPEPAPKVTDPRLSSTYDADGAPIRVGLELWFDPAQATDDDATDEGRQLPRRAAAEAVGDGLRWEADDFSLHAVPLRWHSRGSDGSGVYLLGKRTG